MNYNTIHETVVQDVVDVMKDGISTADTITNPAGAPSSLIKAGSLSKATSGLTLEFPVLVDASLPISTATMCSKAVERKAVSLLQIAFSAYNITNTKDATEFIKSFHTNINHGKITMDDWIDAMNTLGESVEMLKEDRRKFNAVMEDLKRNCNYYLEDDICESSVNDYKVVTRGTQQNIVKVVNERWNNNGRGGYDYEDAEETRRWHKSNLDQRKDDRDNIRLNMDIDERIHQRGRERIDDLRYQERNERERHAQDREDKKFEFDKKKSDREYNLKQQRDLTQNAKDNIEMFQKQLLPSDVKKANELVPSMMIVNFYTTDEKTKAVIAKQVVIGVKARMIPVNPEEVANKLITKYADSNILLKFIRATTREISFTKDFLLALDDAKLNAKANSKRGSSTYKYLKVLERRALNGKVRKALKLNNSFKAISTLVISRETAEYIKRYNSFDVLDPRVIRPIMEKLNFMMFMVADESEESVSIIMDTGDDTYEVLSYTGLEREASDGSYKKAINLMTKVVR